VAIVDKPTELSEHVLEAVKNSQQGALEAVRTFAASIDQALPLHGEGPSKRQDVIDSALAMADRLVQTQYDFLSTLIRSAGKSVGASQPQETHETKTAAAKTEATAKEATTKEATK
jgi:hypothetical protein